LTTVDFFERVAELRRARAAFAVATVVARRAPVSSHLGDRAIVHRSGRMEGFVGGACSRDIVRREALRAIRSGEPRLVQIVPDPPDDDDADPQRIVVPMGCVSEGAVDVYIEPHLTPRRLIVVGFTPVAEMLARIAATLEYDVTRIVAADELADVDPLTGVRIAPIERLAERIAAIETPERERTVAIVASQGRYDEAALEVLLPRDVGFVGLLASRRRAAQIKGILAQGGIEAAALTRLRNPVGIDIGARTPGDVAVSILAAIVADARERARSERDAEPATAELDPVCGMEVDGTALSLEHRGRRYAFCSAHCRQTFLADPGRFAAAGSR
jgi:xanthine dehydrogenase accessory factor